MGRPVLPWVLLGCLWLGGCVGPPSTGQGNLAGIRRYQHVLEKHPERYPLRVSLAQAYLAQAKRTLDPEWIIRARAELERSLATQPSYEAQVTFARVENFAHRFEQALTWSERAQSASPHANAGEEILSIRFEALRGLGRTNEADRFIQRAEEQKVPFVAVAGRARLLADAGNLREAAAGFEKAADQARAKGRADLAAWALVQQAGCYLDSDLPEHAPAILHLAKDDHHDDILWTIHWAEYYQAVNQWPKAMSLYERLLAKADHPLIHHLAWRAARQCHRPTQARRHFQWAEAGYRKAIEAGEGYTLGGLARLYLEADVHREETLQLARSNLRYVKDPEAYQTLKLAEEALHRAR